MARYLLRSPHYVDGNYINASPETPTVIEWDDLARKPATNWQKLDDKDGELEKVVANAPAVVAPLAPAPPAATPPVIRKGQRKNDDDLLP